MIKDIEHVLAYHDPAHACNQGSIISLDNGELLLGLKIESVKGLKRCEEILSVPGIGFAEMGPGDMSMSMGIVREAKGGIPDQDKRIIEARDRVNAACKENGIAFLGHGTKDGIGKMIDTGARVISGADEEIAELGRRYTNSQMK